MNKEKCFELLLKEFGEQYLIENGCKPLYDINCFNTIMNRLSPIEIAKKVEWGHTYPFSEVGFTTSCTYFTFDCNGNLQSIIDKMEYLKNIIVMEVKEDFLTWLSDYYINEKSLKNELLEHLSPILINLNDDDKKYFLDWCNSELGLVY